MDEYSFFFDYNNLIKTFINNNKIVPQTWNIIDKNCVELRYTQKSDTYIENDYLSEIVGAFTTANARVRLYKMMDWLDPSQIAYCDTDSVIFLYDETNPKHKHPKISKKSDDLKVGIGLGMWEDELKDDYIEELVVGGAKSYAYKTYKGKIAIKQKGITLDGANDEIFNFDTMGNVVLNDKTLKSKERHQFKWDTSTKDRITKIFQEVLGQLLVKKD